MVLAAQTKRGTQVHLNKIFYESDVKIITGLVESHFMAGASGGLVSGLHAVSATKSSGTMWPPSAEHIRWW